MMPVRRGHVAPRTTIIETIIRKFDTHNRSFVVANAQECSYHVIYCSDGFCKLTGFSRAEVMQRPAVCDFLHGPLTSQQAVNVVREALAAGVEKHFEILYYKKDGTKFLCSEVIAPVKSEVDDIRLYVINFEDLTNPSTPLDERGNNRLSKFDRARQSFRQSLRMANLRRGRTLGPPTTTEESLTPSPSGKLSQRLLQRPQHLDFSKKRCLDFDCSALLEKLRRLSPSMTAETERLSQSVAVPSTSSAVAPLASPEDQVPLTIPHAASIEGLSGSRRPTPEPMARPPARSATCSVRPTTILMPFRKRKMSLPMESGGSTAGLFSFETYQELPTFYHRFKAATGNLLSVAATRNHVVKCFPNTSSESDLQKYRTSSVWDPAPSLSNIAAEGLRHKYSIPDNGSAKFFQGALHTPNMGEKVAQTHLQHISNGHDVGASKQSYPILSHDYSSDGFLRVTCDKMLT